MDLNQHVLALQDQLLACLQENLKFASVEGPAEPGAPYGAEVRKSLDHVLAAAKALGLKTHNMDGHLGWCEYGEGEEMIAVLGHLDVVPAGEGWSCDPWGGEIKDGSIWGRGTIDDKGPSVAAMYALAALRNSGLPIKRRIRILFGCNEETGSQDMKYYLSHGGEIPVMGFTPDAEYPVINGEKGIVTVTFSKEYQQTGDLKLLSIQGGTVSNVVPSSAWAKLQCSPEMARRIASLKAPKLNYTATDYGIFVESQGVNAHGSIPHTGENAIGRLLLALNTLPFQGETAQFIDFLSNTLGMETDGRSAGVAISDDVSGGLTLNLGILKADQNHLTLTINYRYPVTKTYADCGPILNETFSQGGFSKVSEFHKEGLYIPEDSKLVSTLLRVFHEETGMEGKPLSIGGGTYAKSLPNILAFGPLFPGDEMREHKPNEFLEIDKLMKNAQIIAAAMYAMARE